MIALNPFHVVSGPPTYTPPPYTYSPTSYGESKICSSLCQSICRVQPHLQQLTKRPHSGYTCQLCAAVSGPPAYTPPPYAYSPPSYGESTWTMSSICCFAGKMQPAPLTAAPFCIITSLVDSIHICALLWQARLAAMQAHRRCATVSIRPSAWIVISTFL